MQTRSGPCLRKGDQQPDLPSPTRTRSPPKGGGSRRPAGFGGRLAGAAVGIAAREGRRGGQAVRGSAELADRAGLAQEAVRVTRATGTRERCSILAPPCLHTCSSLFALCSCPRALPLPVAPTLLSILLYLTRPNLPPSCTASSCDASGQRRGERERASESERQDHWRRE